MPKTTNRVHLEIQEVKKGDKVVIMEAFGRSREARGCLVKSVGPKWITVEYHGKFTRDTGYGEYGMRLHTERSLKMERRYAAAEKVIRGILGQGLRSLPLSIVEDFAKAVERAKEELDG